MIPLKLFIAHSNIIYNNLQFLFMMILGIPKEIMQGEARVAATPETVKKFINDGVQVLVEAGAGVGSHYYDEQYAEAGAELVSDPKQLFARADLILKVKEPLFNEKENRHEVDMMHNGQYLITFIHPASPVNHEMVKKLAEAGVTSFTLDGIPRISRAQHMDALTSMSTCAGYKGMVMAADDLSYFMPQMFTAVGMLKPANVLVIGAGVAGLQALATAKRLGAVTYAMDIRPAASEQAKSLGARVIEAGVEKHLLICDNEATDLQYEILAHQMPSMKQRINDAYKNTREFVNFIHDALPGAKINFVSEELAKEGFTPSVFSLDLPTKGNTDEEREAYKRALNLKLINLMITEIPNESKFCVSYGQLKGCYWTIPATSTQGTTKEGDKDYIVRVALSPELDLELHKKVFLDFVAGI